MLYLLAIVFPPLAVLLCGKPLQALCNIILTLCFWVPGVIHAIMMVSSHQADQRAERIVDAIHQSTDVETEEEIERRLAGY